MRVMQIIPELKLAGAQIMMENLANQLASDSYDVLVVSLYSIHTPISDRLEGKGIQICYLDKRDGLDIKVIKKIRECIKKFKPDVIHTHSYVLKYAFEASLGWKCQRIHTVHNIAEKETTHINLLLEKVLSKSKLIKQVAISPLIKKSISEYYGIKESSIPMIYNGNALDKCDKKQDYSLTGDSITIIHIGRFEEQKNHSLIVEAAEILCKKYNTVTFNLWGEGILKEEISEQIDQAGLTDSVILKGTTSDPFSELSRSDIFILPSNWEGMPITLIEAMGTGLPVVVTPVGGIPDMIDDNSSGLYCENDPSDLARKMEMLILDANLRRRLGMAAAEKAKKFSAKVMTNEYVKLYGESR